MSPNQTPTQKNLTTGNFLQSQLWLDTYEKIGDRTIVRKYGEYSVYGIIKDAKRGRYLEIPGGPLIDWSDKNLVKQVFDDLKSLAKAEKCVFIRFRAQLLDTPENRQLVKQFGARRAPMHLHAENTVILDLKKSEEELLAEMRRQTRYEIRRAEKLGVKVTIDNSDENWQAFAKLQSDTAARQGFIPIGDKFLAAEKESFADRMCLYNAKSAEDQLLAMAIIVHYGDEADYFEAASTPENRNIPGSYAIIWQAIKDAKGQGISRFNLFGIAPEGATNHRFSGVTTFKTGFGGSIVNYLPAQDIVIDQIKYLINLTVETSRKKMRKL